MTLLLQVAATGLLFGLAMILLVWLPIRWVEGARKKTCEGCREGTVLFVDGGQGLCHKHWARWDRIYQLEQKLDYSELQFMGPEQRESAMDLLLKKLRDMPEKMPEEPGAVSPKADGSR
jgi:hypothetical protein